MLHSLHRNIRIRLIISFLSVCVSNMVFPFMAMYFAQAFGPALAGILLLMNVIISASASFVGGYLSDHFGRKPMMIIAQAIEIAAFAGMALANSGWWVSSVFTFLMMVVQNLSSGLMHPAEEAMLIDVSTEENRRLMYSINYWSTNFGMAAGAVIGGFFFGSYRFALFLVLTISSIIVLSLIILCMTEVYQRPESSIKGASPFSILSHYSKVVADRVFILFCIGNLLVLSLEFQTTNYIAVHLEKSFKTITLNHWLSLDSYTMISWMRIENTLLVVILALIIAKWTKRCSAPSVFLIGLPIYSLGYAIQAFSNQWALLTFAVFFASIGELMYVPVSQSLIASLTKAKTRASYMAIYGFVFQGSKLFGAIGIIIGAFLPPVIMALLFLLAGLVGLCCYLKVYRQKSQA
ncbi:MFS transporter [Sporolactobacillus pectinivorans]|uniref:MFS transporter n=1 Tax=Sporolactobacillus pectinivorans TaxID=1591408 RepID=UPI000C25D714|nr:MFS transporter [Sporolactobacillus pectinivorans]